MAKQTMITIELSEDVSQEVFERLLRMTPEQWEELERVMGGPIPSMKVMLGTRTTAVLKKDLLASGKD